MTDERIKEAFEKYSNEVDWEQTYDDYESVYGAGFRAAERLAKIEALEEAAKRFLKVEYRVECFYGVLDSMIAELKEEGE